jgi:hypothetical protein
MLRLSAALLALSFVTLAARPAAAHMDGTQVAGYSGIEPGRTCDTCHSGGSGVKVTIDGPARIPPGSTGHYTVTLSAPSGVYGGVDVAVDDAKAKVDADDAKVQLVGRDVVHRTREPYAKGALTFGFTLTAPASAGKVMLYADGIEGRELDTPLGDTGATGTLSVAIDPSAPVPAGSGNDANGGGCATSPQPANGLEAIGLAAFVATALLVSRRRVRRA